MKVVFAGTRQVYGRPDSLPVTESHLVRPTDVNGINKAAGEYYHLVYNNVFGVRACSLRLTNVYGPRQLIKHNRQGFIGWFIRQAIEDREIQIYGDGGQLRDFVYVDDAADAFLRAGASDACNGQVFNVGGAEPISLRDLVELLIDGRRHRAATASSSGRRRRRRSTSATSTPTRRSSTARSAGSRRTPLRDGLARTIEFYRAAPAALRDRRVARRRAVSAPRAHPLHRPAARRGRRRRPRRRSTASSRAAGSCSGPKSRRSRPSSPPPAAPRIAVGVGNGTDAIALRCARSASAPATKSSCRR